MSIWKGRNLYNLVADFETTTTPDDCRVWGFGICEIGKTNNFKVGQSIDEFIEIISGFNSHCYFHNLAFDAAFIIDWLLKNGYTHTFDGLDFKQFTAIIDKSGKHYSISVKWETGKRTEFRDSLKKIPLSVSETAKAFKFDEGKGEIDYHTFRPIGHVLTDEEIDYIRRDIVIIADALEIQFQQGMKRLTVGSDSLAQFKGNIGAKLFERTFPILSNEIDAEIRRAYRGGFTYVKKDRQGKIQPSIHVFDVNSLYPFVMYEKLIPYGEPVYFDGVPRPTRKFPLFIVSITFTAKLKDNHIPCIQIKGSNSFIPTVYMEEINEPTTLVCSSVDLELWKDHYDLNIISFNGGWYFKGVTGIFCDYIDYWNNIKMSTTGGLQFIAKLHLNSLYGKFATNPDVTGKIPILENDVVKLIRGEPKERNPVYTAAGVFITSYARDITIRAAQTHYDVFCYADTDSLHLSIGHIPKTLDIHPTRLGAWKFEGYFKQGLFARAKAYTEQCVDGTYQTHIAGLPRQIAKQVTFDDYFTGRVFDGKLLPRRVSGGMILESGSFTLQKLMQTEKDSP